MSLSGDEWFCRMWDLLRYRLQPLAALWEFFPKIQRRDLDNVKSQVGGDLKSQYSVRMERRHKFMVDDFRRSKAQDRLLKAVGELMDLTTWQDFSGWWQNAYDVKETNGYDPLDFLVLAGGPDNIINKRADGAGIASEKLWG